MIWETTQREFSAKLRRLEEYETDAAWQISRLLQDPDTASAEVEPES